MSRILLDQNVPSGLRHLPGHEVRTAYQMGWHLLANGELLNAAEPTFEVLITCDQNMAYQQNLSGRAIAIVVLPTNNWTILRRNMNNIGDALEQLEPGAYLAVSLDA